MTHLKRRFGLGLAACLMLGATAQEVGIGTTAPAVRLDVQAPATYVSDLFRILHGSATYVLVTNDGRLAVGTNTPIARLHVTNDGMIYADGAFGLGDTIPGGGRTAFIWNPNKGAVRGGRVLADQWTHANVGSYSVAFGYNTVASGNYAAVGGGFQDSATGTYATVGGGRNNAATADYTTVAGGNLNKATGIFATIGGGSLNEAAAYATISGGFRNLATASGTTIMGGFDNIASGLYAVVVGYYDTASGAHSTVLGGRYHLASGWGSVVAGAQRNVASGTSSSVIGGSYNTASGDYSSVSGGYYNLASAIYATVGGGYFDTASGDYATVSGGRNNVASAVHSTVGGGRRNIASGWSSTVAGGRENTASGAWSMIPGGRSNTAAGNYSMAAGRGMRLGPLADYTFVWGFNNAANPPTISASNAFLIGPNGNAYKVGINLPNPAYDLHLANNSAAKPGTNTWTVSSDARLKTNVQPYREGLQALLQIQPVWYEYNGKAGTPQGEKYVGVIAQELQKVAPYMVSDWKYVDPQTGQTTTYLGVDNGAMTYMLINAVKELARENERKNVQIQELTTRVIQLEQSLQSMGER